MAPKSKTAPKTREPMMGIFVDYMRSRGPTPVMQVVREVTQVDEPSKGQLDACLGFMSADDRFIVTGEGIDATCCLVDAERAGIPESKEPEELKVEAAVVASESIPNIPAQEITPAGAMAVTSETLDKEIQEDFLPVASESAAAIQTATIGEQLAASEAAKTEATTVAAALPHSDVAGPPTDHETELETRIQALRALAEELGTFEDEYSRLTKARGEAKKAVDTTRNKMIELIQCKSTDEVDDLPVFKMHKETIPAKSETLQAIAETTAAKVETPTGFSFWDMGVSAAKDPSQEGNCPISRERDAPAVAYWFAGFRNALATDKDSHEAQVQALFHDALAQAALPNNGLLPKGEEQPKVQVVRWNERAHLVLDMVPMESESGDATWNDWYLLPLVDRDEWGVLYEKEFGPAVKGAHENPEKEADRLKGGIDTGRMVKAGRNVFVCSPRRMVAIVYTETQKGV